LSSYAIILLSAELYYYNEMSPAQSPTLLPRNYVKLLITAYFTGTLSLPRKDFKKTSILSADKSWYSGGSYLKCECGDLLLAMQ
jgi:hypothetical protein